MNQYCMCFIHINDLSNASFLLIKKGKIGEAYHVAPKGNLISIKDVVKLICNKMQFDFKLNTNIISENYGQDSTYFLNTAKIRNKTGWKEKISLSDGIEQTIEWIDQNWDKINKMPDQYIHRK